jgi:DNA (cytosine-5)-methyltransferase 1
MKMNEPIVFGSVCSGIEAASVAWNPLGWNAAWLSEIEPFPCALLRHHYPDVPNLGDMREIPRLLRSGMIYPPDVFCGGTPCQAFSLAGLRQSLDDTRGNLSLTFCEIANEIDIQRAANGLLPCVVFWENVPGVLSTKDNAFGHFLAGLAGEDDPLVAPGEKWPDAGCVYGPQRTVAWRVQDAQYFGLAQRRRRVFVVASARNGFDPAAVLFEFEGVRRDSAPRRGQGQETAAGALRSTDGGSDIDHARAGHLVAGTLTATYGEQSGQDLMDMQGGIQVAPLAFGGNNQSGPIDVATARNACGSGSGRLDFETETFLVQAAPAVAFSCKDYGADASVDLAPTMRAMGHSGSHANAGGQLAVCVTGDVTHTLKAEGFDASEDGTGRGQPIVACGFQASQSGVRLNETAGTLDANYGPRRHNGALVGMAVRRLTPRECERLQGFPDDYTLIPMPGRRATPRGERRTDLRMAADGPRYKALGNSWAVKNVRWIGRRIDAQLRALDRRKT